MSTELLPLMTIDAVVERLKGICRSTSVELCLKVGKLVIDGLYRGDAEQWRKRGIKDLSFRKLAARPDLPMSASVLYRCVATYEMYLRIPEISGWKQLHATHLRAVLHLDHGSQRALLQKAHRNNWSVKRLEAEIATHGSPRSRKGRPPMPALMRTLRVLRGHLGEEGQLVGADELSEVVDESFVQEVYAAVDHVRSACERLQARLRPLIDEPSRSRRACNTAGGAEDRLLCSNGSH
jgi:hypothetical protein